MTTDYVTIREQIFNGVPVWMQTSGGRDHLNTVPAKIIRLQGRDSIYTMDSGARIRRVKVNMDDRGWVPALVFERKDTELAWKYRIPQWGSCSCRTGHSCASY